MAFVVLGLRAKIVLSLGLMTGAILVASSTLDSVTANQARLDALALRAEAVTRAQAAALSTPIWDYDREAAQRAFEGISTDPEFIALRAFDDKGLLFAEVVNQELLKRVGSASVIKVTRPVSLVVDVGTIKPIGRVELEMSTHLVELQRLQHWLRVGGQLLIMLLALSIGILIAIRAFTRPIERMTAVMRLRASGDYSGGVDAAYLAREDEIGAIARSLEIDQQQRRDEHKLLEISTAISGQVRLEKLLEEIIAAATSLLEADRSSLFLYDAKRDILRSVVAEGMEQVIELRPDQGIAGTAFASGRIMRLDDAYGSSNFYAEIDRKTGFHTRNMLCIPMVTKAGARIGVIQVLNKASGNFTDRDENRLKALASQAAVALEGAQLFEDVLTMRNFNEGILQSLSSGVISLNPDGSVTKINQAARRIFGCSEDVIGQPLSTLLSERDEGWLPKSLTGNAVTHGGDHHSDRDLIIASGQKLSVNATILQLSDLAGAVVGFLVVIDDVSSVKRTRDAISRYMPKQVVDQLLDQEADALGGRLQTCGILFTDIRRFTTISEEIGARGTVTMLNEYFTEMVEAVDQCHGILDKYIGDAMMVLFGVPFVGQHDGQNAIVAANEMMTRLTQLNLRRQARGEAAIHIGIGINLGDVIAGNIGSPKRMNYTVIGDAVNLAARLEGATKYYGAPILLSEFLVRAAPETEHIREVDRIRVKGKNEPIAIYESYSFDLAARGSAFLDAQPLVQAGIQAYRRQDWRVAEQVLREAAALCPSDSLPPLYLDRLQIYRETPPPESWDGVWTMTSK